jgi:hypothetical protein
MPLYENQEIWKQVMAKGDQIENYGNLPSGDPEV